MLRPYEDLHGMKLYATDGDVGSVHDLLFDDETWTVRYVVVDTGIWLGRLAVVPVIAFGPPDWNGRRLPVALRREEIQESPDIFEYALLTREVEAELAAHYGYPFYWGGPDLWAWAGTPGALTDAPPSAYLPPEALDVDATRTSLYGAGEIKGYHIKAQDGEIGHVDDFVFDDESWNIRYLEVDTSNWIGGRTVLLATPWVARVDAADGTIHVDLTRGAIEEAPEYNPRQPIDRTFEARLHAHYGQIGYWDAAMSRVRTAGGSS